MLRHALSSLVALGLVSATAAAKDYHLYYLGGQSNMDGYGKNAELPAELAAPVEGVRIFHGNQGKDGMSVDGRGLWSELKPGHGRGFTSDGTNNYYSDAFGPEMTFARELRKRFPDRNIAIVKYSRGGTSIDSEAPAAVQFGCWDPDWEGGTGDGKGINQYDHFLATLEMAKADPDIDDDGEPDRLIPAGIVWMQGESDANGTPEIAAEYDENLAELMEKIRAALGDDGLRIVIGRITDWEVWTHGETLRAEQAAFVAADKNATLVTSTDDYGNSDRWHYDTAGYIDLGKQFAEAMVGE